MKTIFKIFASVIAFSTLAISVSAAGFAKTQDYPDGKFTDVSSGKWYAAEVKSSYELGLMNGQSDTLFAPEGNVTVAEGITMASRVHSIYNGKTIAEKNGGKWYDMYIAYATENGLIAEGQFTNYDRNIMRYEMAVMFAKAMPKSHFTAKNEIKDIPDVAKTEEYYDDLMMLYRAGVVMGSDDYGNFYATNPITRSETAAIINRVALPENRKSGTLLEYGNRNAAAILIDDSSFDRASKNGAPNFASGWLVEDTASAAFNATGGYSATLADIYDDAAVFAHRDITIQYEGVVKTEMKYAATGNGARVIFSDSNKNTFLEIVHRNGKIIVVGDKEYETGYTMKSSEVKLYFELDLDNNTLFLSADTTDLGTFATKEIKDFARLTIGTSVEEIGGIQPLYVHMYTNYDVYDLFRYTSNGAKPYGWETTGNAVITPVESAYDKGGVTITDAGKITKKFAPVADKFVYETFILVPEGQSAYVALMNQGKEAVRVTAAADGKFVSGNTTVKAIDNRVWQLVRVEADTNANKALIKINGKDCATVDFTEDSVDSITVAFEGKGEMLVDDVKLYNVFDYPDYCPVPNAVNDDEWYVGMSVCSLWHEGTHIGWQYIDGYEDVEPLIGCYDEGIPEAMDWEIKILSEHGYDFMHFCWYVGTQGKAPIKNTRMCAALTDGYMNAKYSDTVKMSIMWENTNCNFTDSQYFYDYVWPYWCEWFFSDSRYMRIDNKAVLTIYKYENFMTHMGGLEKAAEVVAFMREDIKRFGYDGLILLSTDKSTKAEDIENLKKIGFDARIAYHLGENGYDPNYQINAMESIYASGEPVFLPSVGVGINDVGWTGVRTPMATPEAHKTVLEWAKNTYLPKVASLKEDDWYGKFVIANSWNEYGEGHYIMPTGLNGFGYVDANRAVFSSVAGKNDSRHFDVLPTDNQKSRIVIMHPEYTTSLKKQDFEKTTNSIADFERVYTFDFSDKFVCDTWNSHGGVENFGYDATEKAISGVATSTDGQMLNIPIEGVEIDADRAKYLRAVLKLEGTTNISGSFHFRNEEDTAFMKGKGYTFTGVQNAGEYAEIIIDLSGNNFWTGKIQNVRFDPCDVSCKFYVKSIEFISDTRESDFILDVDGYELGIPENYVTKADGEYFAAGDPAKGFYSLQNIYYEYNRKTGRLYLKTSTGTEFEFTVGSNKVNVNGQQKTVTKAIERRDGLPGIPLKFIYDNSGIEYSETDRGLAVKIRDEADLAPTEKIENQWEFDTNGNSEEWKIDAKTATSTVMGGKLCLTAIGGLSTKTGYDPQMSIGDLTIDASLYSSIQIRMKAEFEGEVTDPRITVYFATLADSKFNEAKTVRVDYTAVEEDYEGFKVLTFDMKSNENWKGYVTNLRVDPTNHGGYYEFDYIRCIVDPEKEEVYGALMQEKEESNILLKAADEGAPFYVKNPDGESITGNFNATSSNAFVELVTDPDNEDNHAYLVTPKPATKKSWTYFLIPTRFKPGATYKVEYDVKVVGDQNGNAVTNAVITPNMRYTDYDENGTLKPKMDHPISGKSAKASTGDGWIHCEIEHTVSAKSPERSNDFFAIYSNPQGTNEAPVNVEFMIDNIVVTVVDAGGEVQNGELNHEVQTPTESGTSSSVILVANPAYSWEFDNNEAPEKWYEYYADVEVKDGKLCMTATPTSGGKYDPQISKGSMSIDAAANPAIKIRLKVTLAEGAKDKTITVYFTTDSDTTLNGAKTVKINLDTITPDAEGFYDLTFDMSSNENWKGTVTRLRLDPTGSNGYFEVDYIRVMTGDAQSDAGQSEQIAPVTPPVAPTDGKTNVNSTYSWEFDKDDKAQKWYEYYAETEIKDGKLCMTATPTSGGKYDPQISKSSMSIDAAANPAIKIRLKAILAEGAKDKTVTIYFTTDSDSTLNGAKTVKINLDTLTPDAEGFYDLTFDMSANENWKGTVTKLRIDPTGSNGYFEIDYIRVMTVS